MSDGPKRAPSSPPDTPEPMKRRPFSRSAFSRRMVSVQSALPPSMMMSPGSKRGGEAVDHGVGGLAGLDQDDGLAGLGQGGGEFLEGLGANDATGVCGFSATNLSVFSVVRL
jgi:hypothetical protein